LIWKEWSLIVTNSVLLGVNALGLIYKFFFWLLLKWEVLVCGGKHLSMIDRSLSWCGIFIYTSFRLITNYYLLLVNSDLKFYLCLVRV
jgi:hypothetical protein